MTHYLSDQLFEKESVLPLLKAGMEFDHCEFKNCDMRGHSLSNVKFLDCVFSHCNLSALSWENTALREVRFDHCKMLGARFDRCNAFGLAMSFQHCLLDHSTFFKQQIKNIRFKQTRLSDCDFTETDLSQAVFDDCDLQGAVFENTRLEKADLRSAYHYQIDPETNKIKGAKFSLQGLPGLLAKYQIRIEE